MQPSRIKLAALDVEGTLTRDPTVWEIMHLKRGTWESVGLPYLNRFLAGEFDYDTFARMDVASWAGAPYDLLLEAAREVEYMPGAREFVRFLRDRGIVVCAISCGLDVLGRRLKDELGIEHAFANIPLRRNGRLSGELDIRVPYHGKGAVLSDFAGRMEVPLDSVLAVGDYEVDVPMFRLAGISVAFNTAEPSVIEEADYHVPGSDLGEVAELVGRLLEQ